MQKNKKTKVEIYFDYLEEVVGLFAAVGLSLSMSYRGLDAVWLIDY